MRYTTSCAISIKGDRVEKGTEVELSAADFKQFDAADFTPVSGIVEEPEKIIDLSTIAVEELIYDQAKARAKELGLPIGGSKADLQERITLHLSTPAGEMTVMHTVTEKDLEENPEWAENGVKVGDEIEVLNTAYPIS